jgi:uncharacterized peroxidase-related enzyme
MPRIRVVEEHEAGGVVAELYEDARESFGFVPDAVKVLSPRPEVAAAVHGLKNVLLGEASTLGRRRADMLATVVSGLNHCEYCATAHAGMLANRKEADPDVAVQLYRDWRKVDLDEADQRMMEFAEKLTITPAEVTDEDVEVLRAAGFSDVEVYDIVFLTAYRNFINRVHDGLGADPGTLRHRFGSVVDAIIDRH